jgi:histone H3/H4
MTKDIKAKEKSKKKPAAAAEKTVQKGETTRTKKKRGDESTDMNGIKKATFRRQMRKGGFLRVSKTAFKPMRVVMYAFNSRLLKYAHCQCASAGRKTVNADDMIRALATMGRTLYGSSML